MLGTGFHLVENTIFWVFAVMAVTAALGVVFHRSVIYAALFLIVVFFSIAGFFVLNNADFLAVSQTIVYGVGLTIVILFGIMFTGDRSFADGPLTKKQTAAYMLVGAMILAALVPAALFGYKPIYDPSGATAGMLIDSFADTLRTSGSTGLLGNALYNYYLLPFEIASVLLLLAMIGALVIAKKQFASEGPSLKYGLKVNSHLRKEAEEALKKAPFLSRELEGLDDANRELQQTTPPDASPEQESREPVGV